MTNISLGLTLIDGKSRPEIWRRRIWDLAPARDVSSTCLPYFIGLIPRQNTWLYGIFHDRLTN